MKLTEIFRPNISVNSPKYRNGEKRRFWLICGRFCTFFNNQKSNHSPKTNEITQIASISSLFQFQSKPKIWNKKIVCKIPISRNVLALFMGLFRPKFRPNFRSTWPKFRFRPKLILTVSVVH